MKHLTDGGFSARCKHLLRINLIGSLFIYSLLLFPKPAKATQLSFLSEILIPTDSAPSGEALKYRFGGVSGATEVPYFGEQENTTDLYLLSDDRSGFGPARMYKAKASFSGNLPQLSVLQEIVLQTEEGKAFEPGTIDPESLTPFKDGFVVAQEGSLTKEDIWFPPTLNIVDIFGKKSSGIPLPSFVLPDVNPSLKFPEGTAPSQQLGQRYNNSFEGISAIGDSIFAVLEGPLVQDGNIPNFETAGYTRLLKYHAKSNKNIDLEVSYRHSIWT